MKLLTQTHPPKIKRNEKVNNSNKYSEKRNVFEKLLDDCGNIFEESNKKEVNIKINSRFPIRKKPKN